jgi:hypothetical protein
MNDELEVVSSAITLPGAKMTETALMIDPKVTDEQLGYIGSTLARMEGSRSWWIGDYGCALQSRRGEAYTEGNAEVLGIEPNTFRQYKMVAEFLPAFTRVNALSFKHHFEAMMGAGGDLAVAQDWLSKAVKEGWSVSELRRAVRTARAEYKDDGLQPTGNGYSALLDADRWARTQAKELDGYTPEQASAILSDLPALIPLLDRLRELARKAVQA